MTALLEIRERIRRFYSNNGRFVIAGAKFLIMFLTLFMVSSTLENKGIFSSAVIILVVSLIVCVLPHPVSLAVLMAVIGYELYAVSLEALIVYAAMIVIFISMYFIFKPGKSYCMIISILLGLAQFYGPLPMVIGLVFTPIYCISMCFGVITSSFISYIAENASMFAAESKMSISQKLIGILEGVFLDEKLWLNLFLAVGVAIIVYLIRRMSVKHSWSIAIVVGCVCTLLLTIIFTLVLDISDNYLVLTINTILEAVTGIVLMFLFFMVDYSREEMLQFEDDEYYYYVKAIPKLSLAIPEMKVTRIREHNIKDVVRTSDEVTFIKDKSSNNDQEDRWEQSLPALEADLDTEDAEDV